MPNNLTDTSSPIVTLDDPWTVAAIILFGLLATVAMYRVTRVCCTCQLSTE